ncbi:MAG: polyphosphate:AMP phosphotransferase [Woeseiaceae bacterium]|nr:polyphosphate:AMP phosphotransferase [Woeseiaceae bacterium]
MFRAAELGQTVSKKEYKARAPDIRRQLLEAQLLLSRTADFSVMIDFAGVDGAGKGSTVNLLHSWMDTRLITTNAYSRRTKVSQQQPRFWRFWRDLPPAGQIALNLRARYSRPFIDRVYGQTTDLEYLAELKRIQTFERMLADDGMLILKFWMHLSRDEQQQRLESLQSDPETTWRVSDRDWEHWKMYDQFIETAERTITETNTAFAPWHIIEGTDKRHRILTVAEIILDALKSRLKAHGHEPTPELLIDAEAIDAEDPIPEPPDRHVTVFSTLDMKPGLNKTEYRSQLAEQQRRIHLLQREAIEQNRSSVLVFEGPDAGGKGGAIRRILPTLDARNYRVLQYGAPTDEEASRHYLWRFWRHLQRAGRLTIFDRSWYGRVLVERVEGFASDTEWKRAYAEINDFEDQLIEHGTILVKFWLHITPEEQLKRFQARQRISFKRWKLTAEDWRNRGKWYEYETAAHDMVKYTSTHNSPWEMIPANDKNYARVKVLETFGDYLEAALHDS